MDRSKLREELQRDEGVRFTPYKDSLGVWTVGVGWNLEARGLPAGIDYLMGGGQLHKALDPVPAGECADLARYGFTLTDSSVNTLLDISIDDAIEDARAIVPGFDSMSDARQRAFVNMAFNLGRKRLSGFRKMLTACGACYWEEAARQMLDSKWARQVGARADRLAAMVQEG